MAKFKMPTRLVLVEWLDACSEGDAGWKTWGATHALKPVLSRSVGYVVRDEPGFVTITSHIILSNGINDGEVSIARDMIKKIRTLKVVS